MSVSGHDSGLIRHVAPLLPNDRANPYGTIFSIGSFAVNRKQRRRAAKLGQQAGPGAMSGALRPAAHIAELLARARQQHAAGQLANAEALYRKILTIDQNQFDSLHLLGVIAHQVGRNDHAIGLIGKAIGLTDPNPALPSGLAADAGMDRQRGRIAGAELAVAYGNLSIALMAIGDFIEALRAIQRSLQLAETENTKLLFVQCLRNLGSVPPGIDLSDNLSRALSEPWGRPTDLSRFVVNFLKSDTTLGTSIIRVTRASTDPLTACDLLGSAELTELYRNRLLCCLLEETVVSDIELERFLTSARRLMLESAVNVEAAEPIGEDRLRFFCGLAQQCLVNEYVFGCTVREQGLVDRLRELLIGALSSGTDIPEVQLVAFASYFPLNSLPTADLLLERSWSAPVAQIMGRHIRDALEERELAASIPRLTPIQDAVSLAVRRQYEESPYPRWMKASPVGRSTTIEAYLRQKFPRAPLADIVDTNAAEILIAGCGTGQHSIETARRFEKARVLAIDLSLASLCYANRKTQELGLKNIEYAQADILALPSVGRSFDVIEVSGVLHHLADPLAGWRLLLSILRPGGLMRLGLYSKLARQELVEARTLIAERGYGPSADDIRRCREELICFERDAPPAKVTQWMDFFSTSTCRDLLFHVQEHDFTLPEIDSFIRNNQLIFFGFDLPGGVPESFRRKFSQDGALADLSCWHKFEVDNPSVFTGMYQFWVRKAS